MEDAFDYIVVGAGTAGCLLANRLSADPARAGAAARGRRHATTTTGSTSRSATSTASAIRAPTGCTRPSRTPGLNGRQLRYPRGKVLGGCSQHQRHDLHARPGARLRRLGRAHRRRRTGAGRSALPDFIAHESHWRTRRQAATGVRALPRRGGGEWRVEKQRLRWDILDAFAQAAQQAGIPRASDFNRGDNEGVGYFEVNQRGGWRWNAAQGLPAAGCCGRAQPRGLDRRRRSTRLVLETRPTAGSRCTGRRVLRGAAERGRGAAREVVLAPARSARRRSCSSRASGRRRCCASTASRWSRDLPGVGAQPAGPPADPRASSRSTGAQTLNTLAASWRGKARIGLEYALQAQRADEHGADRSSAPSRAVGPGQNHAEPRVPRAAAEPRRLRRAAARLPAFTASVCNLNPTSRGTVDIRSARFEDAPLIAPNYLEHRRRTARWRRTSCA